MVGSQTALKAIWASLLKQPPDTAHHHKGGRRDGAQRGLPAVRGALRDHRNVDDQDSPPAGVRRLARSGVHQDGGVRLREGQRSCCWRSRRRRLRPCTTASSTSAARCPSTAPGPAGSGSGACPRGRSFPCESVGVSAYRCSPKAAEAPRRPLRRGGVGAAHAGRSGGDRWIGRSRRAKRQDQAAGPAQLRRRGNASPPTGRPAATAPHDNSQAPHELGTAAFLSARRRRRSGATPTRHALPPHTAGRAVRSWCGG